VQWDVDKSEAQQEILVFEWTESGVHLAQETPRRRGFGSELLERTLSYELGGQPYTEYTPEGLHWGIRLPADERLLVSAKE
jgi:two-component system CheB/CheR fusion protein